jgi:hypothetical protein
MPRSLERALLNFPEGALFNRAGMISLRQGLRLDRDGIPYLRLNELGGDAPRLGAGSFTPLRRDWRKVLDGESRFHICC